MLFGGSGLLCFSPVLGFSVHLAFLFMQKGLSLAFCVLVFFWVFLGFSSVLWFLCGVFFFFPSVLFKGGGRCFKGFFFCLFGCFDLNLFFGVLSKKTDTAITKKCKKKQKKRDKKQLAQLCSQIVFFIFWGGFE